MDIRAAWVLIKASGSSAAFWTRISGPPVWPLRHLFFTSRRLRRGDPGCGLPQAGL